MILRIKGLMQITIISIFMAVGAYCNTPLQHDIAYAGDEIVQHPSGSHNDTDNEDGNRDVAAGFSLRPIALSPTTYTLGGYPRAASLLDLDNDADLDLLVINPDNHNIIILLNKGDGAYETWDSYPVEGYPVAITPTDIDNDFDLDFVVLDSDGMVRTFLNGGDGKFSAAGTYSVPEYSFSMSSSDLDKDDDMDLIVLSAKATKILLNDGKGGFDINLVNKNVINSTIHIIADLNGDEKDDVVLGGKDGIVALLNNGDNSFPTGIEYPTGKMPIAAAAGDLDSDLDMDLVVANYGDNTLSILKNNGDGTFQKAENSSPGKGPNSITLGDVDLDEDLDIVATNGLSGDLSIFMNNSVRPLTIITELDSLPKGHIGQFYETALEVRGGVPPYKWSVVSGSLPPSLHLNPLTGEIISESEGEHGGEIASGTPSPHNDENEMPEGEEAQHSGHEDMGEPFIFQGARCFCLKAPTGLYRFTVQATDSTSIAATAKLYIEVLPQPGKIAGRIKYSGEKKGNIKVGLWAPSQSSLMGLFVKPLYSAIMNSSDEYLIDNVPSESYLAAAFLDVNGDGVRQKDEPFGTFRSRESGGKPETVVVDNGAELTGIDIEIGGEE